MATGSSKAPATATLRTSSSINITSGAIASCSVAQNSHSRITRTPDPYASGPRIAADIAHRPKADGDAPSRSSWSSRTPMSVAPWPPRIRREHRRIGISLGQVSEHSRPRVMVVPDAFAGDEDGVEHELGRLERAEEDQRARLEVTQERTACSSRSATAGRACRGNDRRRRTGRRSAADHSPHPASRCAA